MTFYICGNPLQITTGLSNKGKVQSHIYRDIPMKEIVKALPIIGETLLFTSFDTALWYSHAMRKKSHSNTIFSQPAVYEVELKDQLSIKHVKNNFFIKSNLRSIQAENIIPISASLRIADENVDSKFVQLNELNFDDLERFYKIEQQCKHISHKPTRCGFFAAGLFLTAAATSSIHYFYQQAFNTK